MGSTERERDARRALDRLGVPCFIAFIQAAEESGVLATSIFAKALRGGTSVEDQFFDDDEYGFQLSVVDLGARRYRIDFGCVVDPTAGDGGRWEVAFDENDRVTEVSGGQMWIA